VARPSQTEIDALTSGDQPKTEEQLLSFGTTGRLKHEITNLADADENLTDDVLALSVTTGSNLPTWETTIKRDANTDQTAEGALRRALGLPPAH
jgi:hypothetical protein